MSEQDDREQGAGYRADALDGTDQERDRAEEEYNRRLLDDEDDPDDGAELDATMAKEDRRNQWQDSEDDLDDEPFVAEDPAGDGDYVIVFSAPGAPDDASDPGREPGSVIRIDGQELRTACGHSFATCHTDRCFRSPPALADDDSEAEADAATLRASFAANPSPASRAADRGLVTEALARAVIALTTAVPAREPEPVPAGVINAISEVVSYNWDDEERDYQDNCSDDPDDNQRAGHIFESLRMIRDWLDSRPE